MHLDENAVAAYVGGALSPAEQERIRTHLDECPDCVDLVAFAVRDPVALGSAATVLADGSRGDDVGTLPPVAPQVALTSGSTLGPYVIERLLGAGGMGIVYAAHDPRLERTVALKVMRPELGGASDPVVERVRRESRALARLSHPNVTTVYELGALEHDRLYIAMEYVAGTTLRVWLVEAPRTAEEILATFARAGAGLAAAHAAGIVHRDFKPDNVLLGTDGAIKVTDFGLARLGSERTDVDPEVAVPPVSDHDGLTLTRTGAVVGTPAYMAPEQFLRGLVDARADQFAFCVALYEALCGARPFRGKSPAELRRAVLAGALDSRALARLPTRVRRALRRGLAVRPEDRFAHMTDLLAALAPPRRRLPFIVGGVAAAVVGGIAMSLVLATPATRPCGGAAAEIGAVWNPARRDLLAAAFRAHGPLGASAWDDVGPRLETYATTWQRAHRSACEATRVHAQQSEAAMDLRIACLDQQRGSFGALLDVFAVPDAGVIREARQATSSLPSTTECADVERLGRRAPRPTEPVARTRYAALRAAVDELRALGDVGRHADALARATALSEDARVREFPDLEAEVLFVRAKLLEASVRTKDAEAALFQALVRAQAVHADELLPRIAVDLANVTGYAGRRVDEGRRWVEFARAAITANGGDPLLTARLESIRAAILTREGKLAEAAKVVRDALPEVARVAPGSQVEGELRDLLGSTLARMGQLDEAIALLQQALATRERFYGPEHALTTSTRQNLANALGSAGQRAEALAQMRRVLTSYEQIYGVDSPRAAAVLSNMGQVLHESGKLDEAWPLLRRAITIRERELGPDHPALAHSLANLGYVQLDRRAFTEARVLFERVDAIIVKALGPESAERADGLEGLARAHRGLGAPAQALPHFERALALFGSKDPLLRAALQAQLAAVLVELGRDQPRARSLAAAARPVLEAAGETAAVTELDAAMRRRRR